MGVYIYKYIYIVPEEPRGGEGGGEPRVQWWEKERLLLLWRERRKEGEGLLRKVGSNIPKLLAAIAMAG